MVTAGIEHRVKEEEHEVLPKLKGELDRADFAALGDAVLKEQSTRSRSRNLHHLIHPSGRLVPATQLVLRTGARPRWPRHLGPRVPLSLV